MRTLAEACAGSFGCSNYHISNNRASLLYVFNLSAKKGGENKWEGLKNSLK